MDVVIPTRNTGREVHLVAKTVARFERSNRYQTVVDPQPFDFVRAREIFDQKCLYESIDKYMTDPEVAFVMCVWDAMPGHTSFYDALCRILNKCVWQVDRAYFTAPKAL